MTGRGRLAPGAFGGRRMSKRTKSWLVVILLLAAYLGSYVWLSRRGYAEADQYGMVGFYYFPPENSVAWRFKNHGCMFLYCPLNFVDRSIGLGWYLAFERLWTLSGSTP